MVLLEVRERRSVYADQGIGPASLPLAIPSRPLPLQILLDVNLSPKLSAKASRGEDMDALPLPIDLVAEILTEQADQPQLVVNSKAPRQSQYTFEILGSP